MKMKVLMYSEFNESASAYSDAADEKTMMEIKLLISKGYDIVSYSDKTSDSFFDDNYTEMKCVVGMNAQSDIGIAYYIEDFEEPITTKMLDFIISEFDGDTDIKLFTNSGVDLHSSKNGKYNNITVVRAFGI